jgi:carbamoyl-phosphate synthase small subunit
VQLTDQAVLALEDGTVFLGRSIGADSARAGPAVGEVVFNTAMTGYQEILTDPSYARQLVTLTYPHVGNTGCNPEDDESSRPMAGGLIVRDATARQRTAAGGRGRACPNTCDATEYWPSPTSIRAS